MSISQFKHVSKVLKVFLVFTLQIYNTVYFCKTSAWISISKFNHKSQVFSVSPGTYPKAWTLQTHGWMSKVNSSTLWSTSQQCMTRQVLEWVSANSSTSPKCSVCWVHTSFQSLICSMYHMLQIDLLTSLQSNQHIIDGFAMMPSETMWWCDDPITICVHGCCFCGPTELELLQASYFLVLNPAKPSLYQPLQHLCGCTRGKIQQYHVVCVSGSINYLGAKFILHREPQSNTME
jgi:hypothetical protein